MGDIKTFQETGLSVIVPAYNAAEWLAPTTERIAIALRNAAVKKAEIIIVDDGSSDSTREEAVRLAEALPVTVRVLHHENSGRFLTRKKGVSAAKYGTILFVDTRVWIDATSLSYVLSQQDQKPDRLVWNGHVNVHKKGNVIARFGDSITLIGWRKYFGKPRLTSYGVEDFDHYPKGTGFFLVPKPILLEAISWFEGQTKDLRNSSDDTLLIRHIAEGNRIWLSPKFSCTYFARTTLRGFVKHSYYRGQFFVDGFLRPGTRFFYPLIAFLLLSILVVSACVVEPHLFLVLVGLGSALWLLELITALFLGLNAKDAASLFALSPVFAVTYGAGIWRAIIRRVKG